jgi:hypothetical protein
VVREAGQRVAAAVTIVASIVVVLGSPGSATHAASTSVPSSISPQAAAGVQLPAPPTVGQQAAVRTRVTHTTAAGQFEVDVSMTTAVTAVNPADGSFTTRSTIGTVDVTVGAELVGDGINALVTRSFEQSFTATGAAIPQASTLIDAASMTREQQESGRAIVDAVSMVSVGFPDEPVAVGAAWTSPGTIGAHGTLIPVTYQCLLTTLTDSTYTMEVSYAQSFSSPSDAGVIEATIGGSGTVVGSLTNPLVGSATLHQTVDGIQGAEPLHSDTSIAFSGTGG